MASGQVHNTVTKRIAIPVGVAIFFVSIIYMPFFYAVYCFISSVAGVYTTLLIHPDLDHIEATIKAKLRGSLFDKYWGLRWYIYGKLIPHRHWLSHSPVLSTLFRLIYYFPEMSILLYILSMVVHIDQLVIYSVSYIIGMILSDIVHLFLDFIYSYFKIK